MSGAKYKEYKKNKTLQERYLELAFRNVEINPLEKDNKMYILDENDNVLAELEGVNINKLKDKSGGGRE